jgi:hypothetical protein
MVRDALSTQEVYHRPLLGLARLKRGLGAFRPRQTPTVPGPPKIIEWGGAPRLHKPNEAAKQENLLKEAIKSKKSSSLTNVNTAFAAAAFLKTYGQQLALDVASARAAVTNKLMELANCGDPKFELKALELLGKHSDIGLFTERSEITINYKNPEDLENAIKERVKRLLNADIIDITPLETSIEEELGFAKTKEEDEEGVDDGSTEQN